MPEILRGDFSPKWVHPSRSYLSDFFFRGDFLTEVRVPSSVPGASVPEILIGVIFYTQ